MFLSRPLLIVSLTSAAFVFTAIAPPHLGVGSQPAFAKNDHDDNGDRGNGNGNGGGNSSREENAGSGNGNGSGNDGNNGNRGGNAGSGDGGREAALAPISTPSPGKSAAAPAQTKSATAPVAPSVGKSAKPAAATAVATTAKPNAAPAAAKTPGLDPQIASLHAATANLQAFIHAAPNSKVGLIAAYAKAEAAAETAAVLRDAAKATLDAAAATLTSAKSDYAASIGVLTTTYGYADTSDAALQARLDAIAATDTSMMTPDQIAALDAEKGAINVALADSAEVATAQVVYDAASATLASAETDLANAETAATGALNTAANTNRTPVDPAVKAWVDAQLEAGGVLDFYRAATPATDPTVVQ